MKDDNSPDERKQMTPKGHEIPIPKREESLRNLEKAGKVKPSTSRSPKSLAS